MEGPALSGPGTSAPRRPVEVVFGSAPDAAREIAADFAALDAGLPDTRVWTSPDHAVVLGISRDIAAEVDEEACRRRRVAVIRRASGGGTVTIGPGTLQYALVLPHDEAGEPPAIDVVKRACNDLVGEALRSAGVAAALESDRSGDLRVADRKVGGVALRRRRHATLLHGTLLVDADLALVAAVLRHPASEPAWRLGRAHLDFLANLGPFDADAFARALRHSSVRARERSQTASQKA
jgi:lipoate---protein ligase